MALQVKRYPLPILRDTLRRQIPCVRNGCPLGTDVPALVHAIGVGELAKAYSIARASNPFASSCGHGCHAPCESACRRQRAGAPVAIAALEAFATTWTTPVPAHPAGSCVSPHDVRSVAAARTAHGRKVAVLGGGAAGLACAHDLALLGHQPVVIDAGHEPGGVLTRIIPGARFPRQAARTECLAILANGVEYRPGLTVHDRFGIDALFAQGFAAVFVAVGCWAPADDERLAHARLALDVLGDDHPLDGDAVVLGDGDLALDTARELKRRSRECNIEQRVSLVLTSRAEGGATAPHAVAAAMRERVDVYNGWLLSRVLRSRGGAVTGVEITRDGGRTRRIVPALHVVNAMPARPPAEALGLARDADGFIATDPITLLTSREHVWAGGASAFGHRSVAHAVADGKRAAWQMHAALTGRRVTLELSATWVEAEEHTPDRARNALAAARAQLPQVGVPPVDPFSAASAPDREAAAREAARCYDCSVLPVVDEECTSCGQCVGACPAGAITIDPETRRAVIDGERCTRCTACVDVCPEGSITLARAVWEERLAFTSGQAPVRAPAIAYRPVRRRSLTPR